MSAVEDGSDATPRWQVQLVGYGLVAAGLGLGVADILWPDPLTAAALLLAAPAALLVGASAPEAFEVRWRQSRGLNPVLGAPATFVLVLGLVRQLVDPTLALVVGAVSAAALAGLGFGARNRPELQGPLTLMLVLAVCGALYGYGATVILDVQLDPSAPVVVQAPVLEKFVTHGRSSTAYHLRLGPWGARTTPNVVDVSSATYGTLAPGDVACVIEHPGALGLAWFTVRTCA